MKIYPFLLPIEFCWLKTSNQDWCRLLRSSLSFEVGSAKTSPVWAALGLYRHCISVWEEPPVHHVSTSCTVCLSPPLLVVGGEAELWCHVKGLCSSSPAWKQLFYCWDKVVWSWDKADGTSEFFFLFCTSERWVIYCLVTCKGAGFHYPAQFDASVKNTALWMPFLPPEVCCWMWCFGRRFASKTYQILFQCSVQKLLVLLIFFLEKLLISIANVFVYTSLKSGYFSPSNGILKV